MTIIAMCALYVLAFVFVNLSILFFYRRTFTMYEEWFGLCWWLLLITIVLWGLICVLL